MILAIDAGNSRVKWGCFDNGAWSATGAVARDDIDSMARALHGMPAPRKIVVSNVAGDQVQRKISATLAHFGVPLHRPWPTKLCCGVTNGYSDPSRLGSDRWAALIGARREKSGPLLVINAGTALTIDALTATGDFLGGLIVPGVRLMMRSLATGTAHAQATEGEFATFPTNTTDAIYSGALNAALGAIARMREALATHAGASPSCVISGGAAVALIPHLPSPTHEVPHLVLLGLVTISEATT
jgi:type III pantothenate kinase